MRVCTGLACYLQGGTRVLDAVSGELGIGVGETTDDGALTLEEAPCLFVCAMAPTMELEGGTFESLPQRTRLFASSPCLEPCHCKDELLGTQIERRT